MVFPHQSGVGHVKDIQSAFIIFNILCFLVNAKETLSEFWGEKSNQAECQFDLRYESERLQDGSFVCFVTLPGGSCFGSFEECRTKSEAQNNAAKIALVHSLFNDHSSRYPYFRCYIIILMKPYMPGRHIRKDYSYIY